MNENMGLTPEELDDLAWALIEAFPEVNVNPVHAPDFWPAKATQLIPVINKIRDRARKEGAQNLIDRSLDMVERAERADEGEVGLSPSDLVAGREITLDEAVEKAIVHEPGCAWESFSHCTCGADPERSKS